jgi:hypothetical protein
LLPTSDFEDALAVDHSGDGLTASSFGDNREVELKACPDGERREEYLLAAMNYAESKGLEVKRGVGYKFGFTLKKWRESPADNSRYPGFYVYCSYHAERPDHRDILCFDQPHDWNFNGDMEALRLNQVESWWRPETHYFLELKTPSGNLVDPSFSKFKPEVGDQIIKVFEGFEQGSE